MTDADPVDAAEAKPPSEPELALDREPAEMKEKSFWAKLPADLRNLIVTIIGTLIGGILLAMFVGAGIALARTWSGNPGGLSEAVGIGASVVAGWIALGFLAGALGSISGRRRRVITRPVSIGFFIVASIYGLVLVLGLLGAAAGIK